MRILRNYVLKECLSPFLLGLAVLTCVFLLGYMIQLAHLVINKGVSLAAIGKIFLFYIPVLIGYTLPFACLISIFLAFGRLSNDNEIIAIRANGVLLLQLLVPLAMAGVILSLILFLLNDRVIPYAYHQQKQMQKNLGVSNPAALLEPGVFINAFEKQIIFIHKIDGNRMYDITIYQPQPEDKPTRMIIARRGEFTSMPEEGQVLLKLMDGTSDEVDPKNPNTFYKLDFEKFFLTLNVSKDDKDVSKKPKSMTLAELTSEMERLDVLLVDTIRLRTEFFRKITWSFSPIVFILLGFPMAVITNKREKAANVVLAIICGTAYYLLALGAEALAIENIIPPDVIMWLPTAAGLAVAGFLNWGLTKQ